MKARAVLMFGLGGGVVEWWANGLRLLQTRFQSIGVDTLLVNWDQRQEAYNFMSGFVGWRGYYGASLGAGSAAQYPCDVAGGVNFAGGFQPSMDDTRAVQGEIAVAANVARAYCVRDPIWIDTAGLGQARFVVGPNAKTQILTMEQRMVHDDDWGTAQDWVYQETVNLIGA